MSPERRKREWLGMHRYWWDGATTGAMILAVFVLFIESLFKLNVVGLILSMLGAWLTHGYFKEDRETQDWDERDWRQ